MNTQSEHKRTLLAVTGLSPQILTETLYALAVSRQPAWIPHEIHVITTAEGARRANLALLSEDPAWFHRLCRDYALPPISFDESHIHVVRDEHQQPLEDIRTPADNEQVADFICDRVRALTSDPATALHVSIAGGRKTMGYYLGYALSLFGRPQDRLSHVLVDEPFESSWEFFYPTPYSRVIETRDRSLADTRDAVVTLAEIPFVSLRHGLDKRLLTGDSHFSEVVAAARQALEPPSLHIDLANRRVEAAGKEFHLPPTQLALLTVFARRAKQGKPALQAPPKGAPDPDWANRYLAEYDRICANEMDDRERTHQALKKGMDGDYFSCQKSALHRSLRKQLGAAATAYQIQDGNTRPRRYALELPPEAIGFIEGNGTPHRLVKQDRPVNGEADCQSPSSKTGTADNGPTSTADIYRTRP